MTREYLTQMKPVQVRAVRSKVHSIREGKMVIDAKKSERKNPRFESRYVQSVPVNKSGV
jgi:hypothetical protein